jgi:hypothetical protein
MQQKSLRRRRHPKQKLLPSRDQYSLLHHPRLDLHDLLESSYQVAPEVTTKATADALLAGILGAIATLSMHCQSSGTQQSQSMLLSYECLGQRDN